MEDGQDISRPVRALPVLDYQFQRDAAAGQRRRGMRVGLFLMSLVGAASPFLPFTHGIAPIDVIQRFTEMWDDTEIASLALPFCAGWVAAAWKLRLMVSGRTGRVERVIAGAIGAVFGAITLILILRVMWMGGSSDPTETITLLAGPAVVVAGAGLVAWFWAKRRGEEAATTALHFGYAGNAVLCLGIFADNREIGWYLTLVAVTLMAAETGAAVVRMVRRR